MTDWKAVARATGWGDVESMPDEALAALEATGQEFVITSICGDPGQRAYSVRIEPTPPAEPVTSLRCDSFCEAACNALEAYGRKLMETGASKG